MATEYLFAAAAAAAAAAIRNQRKQHFRKRDRIVGRSPARIDIQNMRGIPSFAFDLEIHSPLRVSLSSERSEPPVKCSVLGR